MNKEEAIKIVRSHYPANKQMLNEALEFLIPELKESDDEKIRKEIIKFLELPHPQFVGERKHKEWIAWLEKQAEEKVNPYTGTSFVYNNHTWGMCARDNGVDILCDSRLIKHLNVYTSYTELSDGVTAGDIIAWLEKQNSNVANANKEYWNGYREGKQEILDKYDELEKQGEQKPAERKDFISIPFGAYDSELVNETITIPDGCVATIEGNKIHIKKKDKSATEAIKEEKVDNANKVEPKFKVGDWVVRKDGGVFFEDIKFAQITEIDGEKHWFDTGLIYLKAEDMRLWTLEDAKDGDILYSKKHNLLWRYKNTKECYFCINLNYNSNNISIGDVMVIPNDVRPATREQRHLLFDKMLQHITSKNNNKKELKKQGEHNPTDNDDKIEPKFHEGDWIISKYMHLVMQILNNDNGYYKTVETDGTERNDSYDVIERNFKLWTITDAMDGDIIYAESKFNTFDFIAIFSEIKNKNSWEYCSVDSDSDDYSDDLDHWEFDDHKGFVALDRYNFYPATKEQRDILFKKMKKSGYDWDADKKELKNLIKHL